MIRVLVVDNFAPMRKTLIEVLQTYPDFEVVGEGNQGLEAWELAHTKRPDVILMDVHMPVCGGVEATRMVKQAYPEMIVIGLTADEDPLAEPAMRKAGADAFVLKGAVAEHLELEILKAIAKHRSR
ncbi:hypothetical protein W02_16820 [Nitrospira sp. KM1]|uniref:response regulator n=1 Tax=Nitrospira sp. KM1 TaxID=1936990 RepID=UPI0013A728BA|nr:response regulator transcription factor [Nitrospira sp. KM1]BCA54542.1 hypothetical protein W02_16820 [Nitrospira sp. KM1]